MAPKMATIVDDVTVPPAVPPPIKYTLACREGQRLSSEGKIVSKYCNISKTLGGVHLPTLYHGEGMKLHARFSLFYRINNYLSENSMVQQHF